MMNFSGLIENHPEILQDRHSLSFARHDRPADTAATFARAGVVLLKEALPVSMVEAAGEALRSFTHSAEAGLSKANSNDHGSWHSPWAVRSGQGYPAAAITSAVVRSWIWQVVEELCGSSDIVILLKWCMARHSVDAPLGIGGHQDAKVVAGDVPFAMWIPFNRVVPGRNSGLGFVVGGPNGLLPTSSNNDIGGDYVLRQLAKLWLPTYEVGDLSVHSAYSPHFTTGYGTGSDRFSLEIRAMPRYTVPAQYLDPVIYVSRRRGTPTIVDTRTSSADVEGFLASAELMQVSSLEVRRGGPRNKAVLGRFRLWSS